MNAKIVDLRYRMKEVLAALDRGEPVMISHRGREKARLVPVEALAKTRKVSDDPAFGMWRNRPDLADVAVHVRRLRRSRFHDL